MIPADGRPRGCAGVLSSYLMQYVRVVANSERAETAAESPLLDHLIQAFAQDRLRPRLGWISAVSNAIWIDPRQLTVDWRLFNAMNWLVVGTPPALRRATHDRYSVAGWKDVLFHKTTATAWTN